MPTSARSFSTRSGSLTRSRSGSLNSLGSARSAPVRSKTLRFANIRNNSVKTKSTPFTRIRIDEQTVRRVMAIFMYFNLPHIARAAEVVGETPGLWEKLTSGLFNTVVNTIGIAEKTTHAAKTAAQAANTTAKRIDDVIDTAGRETMYLMTQVREVFPWMARNFQAIAIFMLVLLAVGYLLKIVNASRSNTRKTNAALQVELRRMELEHEKQVHKNKLEYKYAKKKLRAQTKLLREMIKRGVMIPTNSNFPAMLEETNQAFARTTLQNS